MATEEDNLNARHLVGDHIISHFPGLDSNPAVITLVSRIADELARLREQPVPMILFCPSCGTQHIDAPDERTPGWTNPLHRSHLCHNCEHVWRPADVPTDGVADIFTKGTNDSHAIRRQSCPGRQHFADPAQESSSVTPATEKAKVLSITERLLQKKRARDAKLYEGILARIKHLQF